MPSSPLRRDLLIPRPKDVRSRDGHLSLAVGSVVGVHADSVSPATDLVANALREHGFDASVEASEEAAVRLVVDPGRSLGRDGYELDVDTTRARIVASESPGLLYGAATLAQIIRLHGGNLPCVRIVDAPDFDRRGAMLDVSRDRVPTMDTLFGLVDRLAEWKLNELQLYLEHTFAYAGHETVWGGASPFTPDELRALDAYCRERHIDLVPNQNTFGHMHRWLRHDDYRSLAECPDGVEHPFSVEHQPFSLCPTDPRSLELVTEMLDGLLPSFSSDFVNVGCDETFDLGQGRSQAACEARGNGAVYLDYLKSVHELVTARGKTMQFWGDIIVQHEALVPELPPDLVALEWGYEAGHPFKEHARRFAESGLTFYVCPGTSSWNSLAGRLANAQANLAEAASFGAAAGARGYLITDWGDWGHWQPLPASWPGLAVGASRAWNGSADVTNVAELLNEHVFSDPGGATGRALCSLASVCDETGVATENGSALFFLLRFAHETFPHPRIDGLTVDGLAAMEGRLAAAREELRRSAPKASDGGQVVRELAWVADTLEWACGLGRARLSAPPGTPLHGLAADERSALARSLDPLITQYEDLWDVRSRPGGRSDSAGRLRFIQTLLKEAAS